MRIRRSGTGILRIIAANNNAKSASKDVPPWDGMPRSTKFRVRECLKCGILCADLSFVCVRKV